MRQFEAIFVAVVPELGARRARRFDLRVPVAAVAQSRAQAREAGRDVVIEKLDLRAIGKANIVGEGGSVKVVAEAGDGPVLGVHMIGPHVTDLIAEAMLITSWEASPSDVAAHIHPHPTLSEGVGEAMLALAGRALHTP